MNNSGVYKKNKKSIINYETKFLNVCSKKNAEKHPSKHTIQLIDENGVDLTPLPLLPEDKKIKTEKESVY